MSIIAAVGRRSFGAMALIGSMYVLLTVGGISMVYPFLLMLSTATTTQSDMQEYQIIPRYYFDDNALYRKYLWLRYDTGLGGATARDYNRAYHVGDPNRPEARLGEPAQVSSFRLDEYFGWGDADDPAGRGLAKPPALDPDDPSVRRRAADLDRFLKESAALWPGPPLTETVPADEPGGGTVRYVTDPYGRPLDPHGLSTGLGNRYRTVGYIGTVFVGFSGVGRDQWTRFVERFYTDPDRPGEPGERRISRLMDRHGRPYEQFKQVRPGYDMPTTPNWAIIEGDYLQSDWLFYKAAWLSGAPIADAPPADRSGRPGGPAGVTPDQVRIVSAGGDGGAEYTDVLGRTARWTEARELRALRPSLLMPDFWIDLSNRYGSVEQFNLAIGLARQEWHPASAGDGDGGPQSQPTAIGGPGPARRGIGDPGKGEPVIRPTGRDVLVARTLDLSSLGGPSDVPEPAWIAALRAALTPRQGAQTPERPDAPRFTGLPSAGPDGSGPVLRAIAERFLDRPENGDVVIEQIRPIEGDQLSPTWGAMMGEALGQRPASSIQNPASSTPHPAPARYLMPPRIDPEWARLTYVLGLGSERIGQVNDRLEDAWFGRMKQRGYGSVHIEPFGAFEEVYLSSGRPIYAPLAAEWDLFVVAKVPPVMVVSEGEVPSSEFQVPRSALRLAEHAWRDFLFYLYSNGSGREAEFAELYLPGQTEQQIAEREARGRMLYGPGFDRFHLAAMPIVDRDVVEFAGHAGALRRRFMFGNFTVVLDELVLEGRAMFNTIVLIFLAIATHVTVNPLAAYALSRFRLTYSYKVLLFMLATMAFPPAVGMIPGFLLLKHFGLINTYAALVLPGIASGYTIFLLKGFFDALPQELYEAAEIDGAGKITTFLNVTFPLSKPIFAIITLSSFTAAYSGFMWAFLICPDSKMWTVMVHLFNIQQTTTAPIAMAALVIAAIPTFLVFLFCQNVILRGIIIPSFK